MTPIFFPTPSDFRKWFEKNHDKEKELWVGFYKKDSGKPSIIWSESVDQALCFGWIDGLRKSIDDISYKIRFTPRKPGSVWSAININKVKELTKLNLMKSEGLAAFKKLDKKKARIYSFEQKQVTLDVKFEKLFKSNKAAWKNFKSMPPSYQRTTSYWVNSAKQEITKLKRLNELIADSETGTKIKSMRYGKKQ